MFRMARLASPSSSSEQIGMIPALRDDVAGVGVALDGDPEAGGEHAGLVGVGGVVIGVRGAGGDLGEGASELEAGAGGVAANAAAGVDGVPVDGEVLGEG
jgi:hypothetical protein